MAAAEPQANAGPFFRPGRLPLGCLLVHGFTATPDEMRSVADALEARGFPIAGVQLPGHGSHVGDLNRATWTDWTAAVHTAATELSTANRPVVAIGMSLGALLSLHLAATTELVRVAGVVCCGTPLALTDWRLRVLPWLYRLPGVRALGLTLPKRGRDISDTELRRQSRAYDAIPLNGVVELLALQQEVRALLPRVRVPTLILHGRNDHTAPFENAALLANALPHAPVEQHVFERSWHVLTEDVEREAVAERVVRFCTNLLQAGGASRPDEP